MTLQEYVKKNYKNPAYISGSLVNNPSLGIICNENDPRIERFFEKNGSHWRDEGIYFVYTLFIRISYHKSIKGYGLTDQELNKLMKEVPDVSSNLEFFKTHGLIRLKGKVWLLHSSIAVFYDNGQPSKPVTREAKTFGNWEVDKKGNMTNKKYSYDITSNQLGATDWIRQMGEKTWCDPLTFSSAYSYACTMAGVKV